MSNRQSRPLTSGSKAAYLGLACLICIGCHQSTPSAPPGQHLTQQVNELRQRLAVLEQENQSLRLQMEALRATSQRPYPADLLGLTRIRLTRYTGLYDKDKDGLPEQLIVYVQPLDRQQDVVKAPGSMSVQVWDLAAEPNQALLASWTLGPDQLARMWSATLLTINYRLLFDVPEGIPRDRPLTVKVVFTDAATGKTYTDQRLIEPR